MRKIEVCCTSVEDVVEAYEGGAIRVELCSAISCGGVTPSRGLIAEAVAAASGTVIPRINVNVLIRPREGSFVYSPSEVRTMISDIEFCRDAGVDGVVIGALALAGASMIAGLVRQSAGRLVVMPGSGINSDNIAEIERITHATEFHSTARAAVPDHDLHHVPELGFDEPAVSPGLILRTSRDVVRSLVG